MVLCGVQIPTHSPRTERIRSCPPPPLSRLNTSDSHLSGHFMSLNLSVSRLKGSRQTRSSVPFIPPFTDRKVMFLSLFIDSDVVCQHLVVIDATSGGTPCRNRGQERSILQSPLRVQLRGVGDITMDPFAATPYFVVELLFSTGVPSKL